MGGVVEALADRAVYLRSRLGDFKRKQQDLFKLISDLELLTPDTGLDRQLSNNTFFERSGVRETPLMNRIYLNALDLMYIWMRQPRAPGVIRKIVVNSSAEERRLYVALQQQLTREKEVTQLLESGIFGEHARQVVYFYRHAYKLYLSETASLAPEKKV